MADLAGAIIKSMALHERKESDFYPTPEDATQAIIDFLEVSRDRRVLCPECGDGKMARVLHANGYEVTSSDLRYTGYGEGGVDFLTTEYEPGEFDIVWMNPPFSLSEAFIRKALKVAPVVIVLLKSNYWHTQEHDRLWDECAPMFTLPLTWRPAFLQAERGNSPLMDVQWSVWMDFEALGVGERDMVDGRYHSDTVPLRRPWDFPRFPVPVLSVALVELREAIEANMAARDMHGL